MCEHGMRQAAQETKVDAVKQIPGSSAAKRKTRAANGHNWRRAFMSLR
jgi:hypothetical protein